LKTKDGGCRIRGKRLQAIEKAGVRAGAAGSVSEVLRDNTRNDTTGSGPLSIGIFYL
jgi:hypothetical protein